MMPKHDSRLRGLYFITPAATTHAGADARSSHHAHATAALRGGARLIQFRDKTLSGSEYVGVARELTILAHAHDALCIINDDIELAARVGADGVHLGHHDPDPETARRHLGDEAVIGVSCYNQIERAHAATRAGASYVAFGTMFASPTKPQAVPAGPELIRQARAELTLPICAIGGIDPDNAAVVAAAGADMLAVIQGISAQQDPEAAARRISRLFA